MITRKMWALYKPDADKTDSIFLFGLDCKVEVVLPEPFDIESMDGKRWKYAASNPCIRIETTCEKQESMLQLKYGDKLVLMRVYHDILPTRTRFPE